MFNITKCRLFVSYSTISLSVTYSAEISLRNQHAGFSSNPFKSEKRNLQNIISNKLKADFHMITPSPETFPAIVAIIWERVRYRNSDRIKYRHIYGPDLGHGGERGSGEEG